MIELASPVMARETSNVGGAGSTRFRLVQVVACGFLLACKSGGGPADSPPAESTGAAEVSDNDAPEEPYAIHGPLRVSISDFEEEVAWRSWLTGEPIEAAYSEEWREDDSLLGRLTAQLFENALLRYDAERWEITPSDEELAAVMADMPVVSDLIDSSEENRAAALAGTGLTWDGVVEHAELVVLMEKWHDHRIENLTDEDLERAYVIRNDRAALETAIVPNIHPRQTIERIIQERAQEVQRYYDEHRNFFLMPRGARIREVAVEAADAEAGRVRAEALLELARTEGIDAALAEEDTSQPMTRGNAEMWIAQPRFPDAFGTLPGEISELIRADPYWIFVEVLEHRGRELRPLGDEVREQIAHHLAREEAPAPEAMERANALADALRATPTPGPELYREHRVLSETTSSFQRTPTGVVPTVGVAPELSDLVFAEGTQVGDVLGPVHTSAGLVVARVLSRERPAETDFETNRESFTDEFAEYMQRHAWPARVAEFSGLHERAIDLDQLRAHLNTQPADP